jgi:NAD(P)-dependent dehydrogenase (short-subunit alcohol dehydrogenase family)
VLRLDVTDPESVGEAIADGVASKCAVEGFTESLSNELELFSIRARLIEPGLARRVAVWTAGTYAPKGVGASGR